MQAVDFVAVSAITVIGSVVGAGCGMRPKAVDNWEVTPNLWGACIGRPSVVLKSPSMAEVMGLLDKLQSKHKEKYATKSTGDCIRWETSANQGLSDSGIISTPSA
jgi:hypothetical protein